MAGHSKWANIKHKKGAADKKRGKIFNKIIREVEVAARLNGGDPDANPRLRDALAEARSNNVPKDNIQRAIKRGTGELEGVKYESITYEGYGPKGVAILIESLTDNKVRTVADVRSTVSHNHGNLGEAGSVAWMFERKGLIVLSKDNTPDEAELMDLVIESGGEDLKDDESQWEIITDPSELMPVKEALEKKGIVSKSAVVTSIPKNTVKIEGDDAKKMIQLMEALEDMDDVQKVYANFDIDEKELENIGVT